MQVFDLGQCRPDKVLAQIWQNLDDQERQGNPRAALVRSRLRILACGGDGTVAWIMKVVKQLNLQPQPAVAIMPLGTGKQQHPAGLTPTPPPVPSQQPSGTADQLQVQ